MQARYSKAVIEKQHWFLKLNVIKCDYLLNTGTPLIGRFLGQRIKRLNRNMSLSKELLWYKLVNREYKKS